MKYAVIDELKTVLYMGSDISQAVAFITDENGAELISAPTVLDLKLKMEAFANDEPTVDPMIDPSGNHPVWGKQGEWAVFGEPEKPKKKCCGGKCHKKEEVKEATNEPFNTWGETILEAQSFQDIFSSLGRAKDWLVDLFHHIETGDLDTQIQALHDQYLDHLADYFKNGPASDYMAEIEQLTNFAQETVHDFRLAIAATEELTLELKEAYQMFLKIKNGK